MVTATRAERAADADRFRVWMRSQQQQAEARFGVAVIGPGRWGWRDRSVSAPVIRGGEPMWLRVGTERARDLPHPCWDGIPTASTAIADSVPMPRVLDSAEWDAAEQDPARRVRADLMTRLPGQPCSASEVLRGELDAPDAWWEGLRSALDAVAASPGRDTGARAEPGPALQAVLGEQAGLARVTKWETVHGDLHWAQLLAPQLGLLDWEMWGTGAACTDAAALWVHAAPCTPDTAALVWALFADRLETPAGRTALVRAAARAVHRAPAEWPDLEPALRELLASLLDR